jgi:HK97 gp10 family phage protein
MADIEIKGLEEVIGGLKKLEEAVQGKILAKACRDGAKVILAVEQAEAPVKSGFMKSEIKIRSSSRKSQGIFRASVGVSAKDYVGDAFYASFVIYGHMLGSRKLGDKRKVIPGNDFLKRSAAMAGDKAAQTMIDSIAKGIEGVKP